MREYENFFTRDQDPNRYYPIKTANFFTRYYEWTLRISWKKK